MTTPLEIVLGLSFGLLLGLPLAGLVGFGRVVVGNTPIDPSLGVLASVSAVAVAGLVAASMELTQLTTAQLPRLSVGAVVVFALTLYADSAGRQLADELPRTTARPTVRTQTLSADAIDDIDAAGQLTVRPAGRVRAYQGYPPLGSSLRTTLENGRWRLPADVPLSTLETRLEDRLRTNFNLAAVDTAIDGRGRVTITAAPPTDDLATDVPSGWRAVSVTALVPAGLGAGDEILVSTAATTARGIVLRLAADEADPVGDTHLTPAVEFEESVLLAVPTPDAAGILEADSVRLVVTPQRTSHVSDAVSLLERDGATIQRVTITTPIREAVLDDTVDIDAIAVRSGVDPLEASRNPWTFDPSADALEVGAEAFLVGTAMTALESLERTRPTTEVSC